MEIRRSLQCPLPAATPQSRRPSVWRDYSPHSSVGGQGVGSGDHDAESSPRGYTELLRKGKTCCRSSKVVHPSTDDWGPGPQGPVSGGMYRWECRWG